MGNKDVIGLVSSEMGCICKAGEGDLKWGSGVRWRGLRGWPPPWMQLSSAQQTAHRPIYQQTHNWLTINLARKGGHPLVPPQPDFVKDIHSTVNQKTNDN